MDKRFYDTHIHAMNLSHPNLTAFINRIKPGNFKLSKYMLGAGIISLFSKFDDRILNLISLMDNDIGSYFMYMEYYLRNSKDEGLNFSKFAGDYNKIILVPVIVDFGYDDKKFKRDIFYKGPPSKPVITQTSDIFHGIIKYNKYKIVEVSGKMKIKKRDGENQLFEIYPFMGINPTHYLDIEANPQQSLEKDLNKYFEKYTFDSPTSKYSTIKKSLSQFNGDLYDEDNEFNGIFAGVKLYPPIDFDPWPDDPEKKELVEILCDKCVEKEIPITVHCSDGGYRVMDNEVSWRNTSPKRWRLVLEQEKYHELKINLAHFGHQNNKRERRRNNWQDEIIKLIEEYPNVYTDFSDCANDPSYYDNLIELISNSGVRKLKERILFGSDFMINLITSDSYNEYLKHLFDSKIDEGYKDLFCVENPERFLWGGSIGNTSV